MTYRVVCPHCHKEVLESNEKFNPSITPNGTMFNAIPDLKVRQAHRQWPSTKGQNFPCPLCMRPLTNMRGNVTLRESADDNKQTIIVPFGRASNWLGLKRLYG